MIDQENRSYPCDVNELTHACSALTTIRTKVKGARIRKVKRWKRVEEANAKAKWRTSKRLDKRKNATESNNGETLLTTDLTGSWNLYLKSILI
jgi:hypothetical protein